MTDNFKTRVIRNGDQLTVKILIYNPMEDGNRTDRRTGNIIPAHYVSELGAYLGDKELFFVETSPAVSKNPYFSFTLPGIKRDAVLTVFWNTNLDEYHEIDLRT